MKKVRIHTPRPQTTLPHHEQAARRARAKTGRPSVSRKSRPTTAAPTRPADFRTHPLLHGDRTGL